MDIKRATAWVVGGVVAAGIAGAVLLGWAPWSADGVHHLDAGNDGAVVELEVGEQVVLRLDGNPTTGYAWAVTSGDPAVLAPSGEPDYESSGGGEGAGGVYTFRFNAVGAGRSEVVLEYYPSWEEPSADAGSFHFTAVVG